MLIEKIILFSWPLIAVAVSFTVRTSFLGSTAIFIGVLSLYLSWRHFNLVPRALSFSLATIPFTFILDYAMETKGGWYIPHSVFDPYRILGIVTVDILICWFLWIYLTVLYYEAFLDHHTKRSIRSGRFRYFLLLSLVAVVIFILAYGFWPDLLQIDSFYLKGGVVFVLLPIVSVLLFYPGLLGKFFKAGVYFFYLFFAWELVAQRFGLWTFPGENQFVGFMRVGSVHFPLEEFIFWIALGQIAVLSYFEFWDDDQK